MSEQSDIELSRKLKELDDAARVVTNGLNWLADVEVKVAYIQPISEFIGFLNGVKGNIEQQRKALDSVMPKTEAKPIETEVLA